MERFLLAIMFVLGFLLLLLAIEPAAAGYSVDPAICYSNAVDERYALWIGESCRARSVTYPRRLVGSRHHQSRRVRPSPIMMPRPAPGRSRSLNGIVAPLAAVAHEIVHACGSHIMSAMRNSFVAFTHRLSLHAIGRAVDITGNPRCIYAHLRRWPGGVSVDYHSVRCHGRPCPHVHVSYAPHSHEWGTRFVHAGTRRMFNRRRYLAVR